jgi:hypothetical protein
VVLEARALRREAREHEAAILATRGARARPNVRLVELAAQPSGTGTEASRPSVSKLQP